MAASQFSVVLARVKSEALRDRVEIYLQERRVQFNIISSRQADYWSAVSSVY